MYCKNCGKILNESEKICDNCGAKVENTSDIENHGSNQTSNSYEHSLQPKKKKI